MTNWLRKRGLTNCLYTDSSFQQWLWNSLILIGNILPAIARPYSSRAKYIKHLTGSCWLYYYRRSNYDVSDCRYEEGYRFRNGFVESHQCGVLSEDLCQLTRYLISEEGAVGYPPPLHHQYHAPCTLAARDQAIPTYDSGYFTFFL